MTEEQKFLLEMVAEKLGGTLHYWECSDKFTTHNKITIEYNHARKDRQTH